MTIETRLFMGCGTCEEVNAWRESGDQKIADELDERCPYSERPCGHHCNCIWVHDHCHWCDCEWGDE